MPNLMLTNWCNYKCPYCFGVDFMAPKVAKKNMSHETLSNILTWLSQTPEIRELHLMGGEPTLHPDFEWIVAELLNKDYHITIFSNLATQYAPDYADKLADLPISWVVNVNPPHTWKGAQNERIRRALKTLGQKATITFNIMPDDKDNTWAVDLIKEYNLSRRIKIGFVLPTLTGSNYSLEDEQYSIVADKVIQLAKVSGPENIKFEFECGVPTCTFTDEQLGILWEMGSMFSSTCCSRLDINPDGECIYCLPLATLASKHFSTFRNYTEARHWFEAKLEPYRKFGRNENCQTCNMLNNPAVCRGGCVAKMLLNAKNVK